MVTGDDIDLYYCVGVPETTVTLTLLIWYCIIINYDDGIPYYKRVVVCIMMMIVLLEIDDDDDCDWWWNCIPIQLMTVLFIIKYLLMMMIDDVVVDVIVITIYYSQYSMYCYWFTIWYYPLPVGIVCVMTLVIIDIDLLIIPLMMKYWWFSIDIGNYYYYASINDD